jgi:hypothetical protein
LAVSPVGALFRVSLAGRVTDGASGYCSAATSSNWPPASAWAGWNMVTAVGFPAAPLQIADIQVRVSGPLRELFPRHA